MTNPDPDIMTKAMNRYDKAMQDFDKAGGYAAQSEAIAMADGLGLPQDVMQRPLGTLSGGQRRRIELARILFSDADTLILDEPTNHLDADSIEWLRGFLKKYEGGFLVISHSTELLDEVVNKVWHLDAQTGQIDMYSLGWKAYLHQRVVDEERRRREREVAEKKADRLMKQGIRLHAKATKAVAAQNMMRRAERLLSETSDCPEAGQGRRHPLPEPAPCGRTPIMAKDISKAYGSNIVFAGVNLAVDKGSRVVILGYNGAGKTTTLRLLAHIEDPDTGVVEYGHGCKIGYFAQEHDTLDLNATVLENLTHVAPELNDTQARSILGSFLFSGDDAFKPARVLSGGEKTRLALATLVTSRANVLLLDEPTNNLDPASRDEILKAIAKYEGAIVLVTHDEGAVQALNPERVLLDARRGRGSVERFISRPRCRGAMECRLRRSSVAVPSYRFLRYALPTHASLHGNPLNKHHTYRACPYPFACLSARRNDDRAHLSTQTTGFAFLCSRTRRSDAHLSTQTRLDP